MKEKVKATLFIKKEDFPLDHFLEIRRCKLEPEPSEHEKWENGVAHLVGVVYEATGIPSKRTKVHPDHIELHYEIEDFNGDMLRGSISETIWGITEHYIPLDWNCKVLVEHSNLSYHYRESEYDDFVAENPEAVQPSTLSPEA